MFCCRLTENGVCDAVPSQGYWRYRIHCCMAHPKCKTDDTAAADGVATQPIAQCLRYFDTLGLARSSGIAFALFRIRNFVRSYSIRAVDQSDQASRPSRFQNVHLLDRIRRPVEWLYPCHCNRGEYAGSCILLGNNS